MARYSWIIGLWIVVIQVAHGEDPVEVTLKESVTPGAPEQEDTALSKKEDLKPKVPAAYTLTARNFGNEVGDGNRWLLEFHAPWCGHCSSFAPTYAEIARTYHAPDAKHKKIKVGKVDGTTETALSSRFAVYGYPSFYMVDGWSVYKYDDRRTQQQLMQFAEGGYLKQAPIPFYLSPMGPVGLAQAFLISSGVHLSDFFKAIQHRFGLSPVLAGVVIFAGIFYGCFFAIVILAVLVNPKAKTD